MRHTSRMVINLPALSENVEKIRQLAPKANILPMVKGNAYGNGIVPVARWLVDRCGLRRLGVASLGEALEIMDSLPDFANSPLNEIVVFSDTEVRNSQLRRHYAPSSNGAKLYCVLGSVPDCNAFLNEPTLSQAPLFLKVNTGMNRVGVSIAELDALIPSLRGRGVHHLLQHFATSSNKLSENDKTSRQLARFQEAKELLSRRGVSVSETSISNSGAIEQGIGINETWVRPGLMLYGPPSVAPDIVWDGKSISRLETKILQRYFVEAGHEVGYGHNVVPEDSIVVMLPLGYADGMLRSYTGTEIEICGEVGRIHGSINMDMMSVVFPAHTSAERERLETKLIEDTFVTIWTHDNRTIHRFAESVNNNAYQVLCGVSSRIPRVYETE